MRVRIKKAQLNHFIKKALASKNEVLAFLVGKPHIEDQMVEVLRIAYPRIASASDMHVHAAPRSQKKIILEAAVKGHEILGTIHSHPDEPPEMSPDDYSNHLECRDIVSGIVSVQNGEARVVFWQADKALKCDLEYIKR